MRFSIPCSRHCLEPLDARSAGTPSPNLRRHGPESPSGDGPAAPFLAPTALIPAALPDGNPAPPRPPCRVRRTDDARGRRGFPPSDDPERADPRFMRPVAAPSGPCADHHPGGGPRPRGRRMCRVIGRGPVAPVRAAGPAMLRLPWSAAESRERHVARRARPAAANKSLVATNGDTARGQLLNAGDLLWQPWPEDVRNPAYIQVGSKPIE